MKEEILGAFPGWIRPEDTIRRKEGNVGGHVKLVFTTDRLIVAKEKGFWRGLLLTSLGNPDYIFTVATKRDRLKMQEVSVEGILKENAENFEIPYSDITAIELKRSKGGKVPRLDLFMQDLSVPKYKLNIWVKYEKYIGVIEDFVRAVLPDKV